MQVNNISNNTNFGINVGNKLKQELLKNGATQQEIDSLTYVGGCDSMIDLYDSSKRLAVRKNWASPCCVTHCEYKINVKEILKFLKGLH